MGVLQSRNRFLWPEIWKAMRHWTCPEAIRNRSESAMKHEGETVIERDTSIKDHPRRTDVLLGSIEGYSNFRRAPQ